MQNNQTSVLIRNTTFLPKSESGEQTKKRGTIHKITDELNTEILIEGQ